jgi:transposase-like protein
VTRPDPAGNGRETPGALSPKQEAAALALASGRTVEAAAREAGCGGRTIRTWMAAVPEFPRRVTGLRSEMTSAALGRLLDGMASAADTLAYLSRKGKSQQTRYLAARAVLELGPKLRESTELADRVAALEAAQAEQAAPGVGRRPK